MAAVMFQHSRGGGGRARVPSFTDAEALRIIAEERARRGPRSVDAPAPLSRPVEAAPEPVPDVEPLPDQVCSVGAPVLSPVAAETHREPAERERQLTLFGEEFWVEACTRFNASTKEAA